MILSRWPRASSTARAARWRASPFLPLDLLAGLNLGLLRLARSLAEGLLALAQHVLGLLKARRHESTHLGDQDVKLVLGDEF